MKKLFTLLCVALVSAIGFAQDAYDPTAHTCVVSGTDNLCSGNWSSEDAMAYDAQSGLWKITLAAKNTDPIEFKIVYDGGWYGKDGGEANYKFLVEEASDVDITFDPQTMLATYSGEKVKEFGFTLADVKYIIAAGSADLLNGVNWGITEEDAAANKMTAEDVGYYTLLLEGIAAGTYEFKFVANGSWSAAQWGAVEGDEQLQNGVSKAAADNGKNFKITLAKGALYNVTLTLDIQNLANPSVTAEWEAAGEAPIEDDVYSVVGSLNGWNEKDETTEMTKVSEGVYTFTLPLRAGSYDYKVVVNHAWAGNYGAAAAGQEGDNATFTLENDADVTFTLDLTGDAPSLSTAVGECSVYFVTINVATEMEAVNLYACQGTSWENLTGSWPGAAMTKVEGGFTAEVKVTKGETLQLIFNGEGGQTSDLALGEITKNTVLNYVLKAGWIIEAGDGIQNVVAAKQNSTIYNLAGQRVEKAIRGLYIINGKKVLK